MGKEQLEPQQPDPEVGFDTSEVIALLQELKDHGIDFEDDDFDHLHGMPPDEAMEYTILTLESVGIDSEALLQERGIIQDITENSDEVKTLQNSGQGKYATKEADGLYQSDLEQNKNINKGGWYVK